MRKIRIFTPDTFDLKYLLKYEEPKKILTDGFWGTDAHGKFDRSVSYYNYTGEDEIYIAFKPGDTEFRFFKGDYDYSIRYKDGKFDEDIGSIIRSKYDFITTMEKAVGHELFNFIVSDFILACKVHEFETCKVRKKLFEDLEISEGYREEDYSNKPFMFKAERILLKVRSLSIPTPEDGSRYLKLNFKICVIKNPTIVLANDANYDDEMNKIFDSLSDIKDEDF